jgi:hypothetical protein
MPQAVPPTAEVDATAAATATAAAVAAIAAQRLCLNRRREEGDKSVGVFLFCVCSFTLSYY